MSYYVYIMSNRHRTVLYIGMTNSLERRVQEHQEGRGSTFTARYQAKELVYYEEYERPQDAIDREKQLKKWRREKKENLICRSNPEMRALNGQIHGLS